MLIAPETVVAIPAAHVKKKEYLQVVWQYSRDLKPRLKVMPTRLGRHELNAFWPYWLRQLILRRAKPLGTYTVEIQNKYVLIAGGDSRGLLEAIVMEVASLICPLRAVLKAGGDSEKHTIQWAVRHTPRYVPLGMIVAALEVPDGATVSFNRWWYFDHKYPSQLSVLCRHNDKRSLRELRLSIELQVALMCK